MNGYLLALSFVLGAVFTVSFTLRRVRREMPVYESSDDGTPAEGTAVDPPA